MPRRSIVFASWSGGEYGSIGATEWLEVRIALQLRFFSYCSLFFLIGQQYYAPRMVFVILMCLFQIFIMNAFLYARVICLL